MRKRVKMIDEYFIVMHTIREMPRSVKWKKRKTLYNTEERGKNNHDFL